jgi:hypothetical protein
VQEQKKGKTIYFSISQWVEKLSISLENGNTNSKNTPLKIISTNYYGVMQCCIYFILIRSINCKKEKKMR